MDLTEEKPSNRVKVLLLLSGGIDSTALLDYYLKRKSDVLCIHFQYDQPNAFSELISVENIATHYNTEKKIIELKIPMFDRRFELIGRNAFFILAASSLGYEPAKIALGIHKGSNYYDCSQLFLKDIQNILDGYFAGTAHVDAPFLNFF